MFTAVLRFSNLYLYISDFNSDYTASNIYSADIFGSSLVGNLTVSCDEYDFVVLILLCRRV